MPPKFTPLVSCRECKGTGKQKLPEHLRPVLRVVRAHPGSTATQIWQRTTDCTPNAVQARLRALEGFLLIKKTPKTPGNPVTYTATSTKPA